MPFGMRAGLRQQHQPRRFERRSRHHDDLRPRLVGLSGFGVDERDAARLAGLLVDEDLAGDRVRPQRQVAGVHRGIDQSGRRVERGVDVAAAGAPVARAAAETPAAILVVLQAVGGHARAIRRQHAVHLLQRVAQRHLGGREPRRALKQAVGQMRQVLFDAGNPEIQIDPVVVRRDVLVGDRPVLAVAVVALRLEVVVRQPQREPVPRCSSCRPGTARAPTRSWCRCTDAPSRRRRCSWSSRCRSSPGRRNRPW